MDRRAGNGVTVRARLSGAGPILIATVVAGLSGYVILAVVAAAIGPQRYAAFSILWSTIYLIVGTLSGVQQEVSRATSPRPADTPRSHVARNAGAVAALAVGLGIVATSPLWIAAVIPGASVSTAVAIAVGCAGYTVVAVLAGTLYGLERWHVLAWMIALDGVIRLVSVATALIAGGGEDALAWAVALPFPLTIGLVWLVVRRRIVGASQLDVGYRRLAWNVARTLLAAASMAALISGFPLLLGATSVHEDTAALGVLVLIVTLTRAPLVIPVLSLQSYLIVRFRRGSGPRLWRGPAVAAGGLIGVAMMLAFIAAWIGPLLLPIVFGEAYRVDGFVVGAVVVGAGMTAALCVTGPAMLALGKHGPYTAGWLVAVIVTVALLLVPADLEVRASLALVFGPLAGVLVHLGYLVAASRSVAATGRVVQR